MTDYERFGDYQPSEHGNTWALALTTLLIGLGAGALAALLLAPRSGRQTRKMWRRKYEDTLENIGERTDELRERGTGWAETAKGWVGSARERAEDASSKVKPLIRDLKKR